MKYRTILVDPPWPVKVAMGFKRKRQGYRKALDYSTMTVEEIGALNLCDLADDNCHCWLWTTNVFLPQALDILEGWGFKYHCPVTWVKPSGVGAYFISRTQTLLFGYRGKIDMKTKFRPNVLFAPSRRHSQKPECSYELIEQVSHPPRLELFARWQREGWTVMGNEIDGLDIREAIKNAI